jgi:hypothetical protein
MTPDGCFSTLGIGLVSFHEFAVFIDDIAFVIFDEFNDGHAHDFGHVEIEFSSEVLQITPELV